MSTTETMLNKPAEHGDLLKQQVVDLAENNFNESNSLTAFHKDVADILAILDSFGAEQPTTDRVPEDAPLTVEEQNRLADLLKDTGAEPKNHIGNKGKRADILQVEVTENHGDLNKLRSKTCFAEQEQNKLDGLHTYKQTHIEVPTDDHQMLASEIDGLLTNIQTQLETVIVEHEKLSKELVLTRALVEELENDRPDIETEKLNQEKKNRDIERLRSELTKITKWHKVLTVQVQKLLKVVENSHAESDTLEANLIQSHETIRNLKNKVQPLQDKLEDYDNMITNLHTQFVDQTAILTATHEKLLYEVSQRRKAEQMLRKIKSRLAPLTRTKR